MSTARDDMPEHLSLLCRLLHHLNHDPCHSISCDRHGLSDSDPPCGKPCQCWCHQPILPITPGPLFVWRGGDEWDVYE